MASTIECPVCKEHRFGPLWSVSHLPTPKRTALKLMEVEDICHVCWESSVSELSPEEILETAVNLMDDYTTQQETHKEQEEEWEYEKKTLEEENKEKTETLEDLQKRIADIL